MPGSGKSYDGPTTKAEQRIFSLWGLLVSLCVIVYIILYSKGIS